MKRDEDLPTETSNASEYIAEECIVVTDGLAGQRFDRIVFQHFQNLGAQSRSQVVRWIADGLVLVNDAVVRKAGYLPREGDLLKVHVPAVMPRELGAEEGIQFEIIYEDADLLVINKPAGLVVHPGAGQPGGTLINGVMHHLGADEIAGLERGRDELRPGIVHRLDKNTSGLMIVARNDFSLRELQKQFLPPRKIERRYLALVMRVPAASEEGWNVIDRPISRHPSERSKMSVVKSGGRSAVTRWRIKESYARAILLELALETGRTHQIRVHLSSIGCPIVGDEVYGYGSAGTFRNSADKEFAASAKRFGRQALHAYSLSFNHPRSGERLQFTTAMPADMLQLVEMARNGSQAERC